jgi:hypothetical protein
MELSALFCDQEVVVASAKEVEKFRDQLSTHVSEESMTMRKPRFTALLRQSAR